MQCYKYSKSHTSYTKPLVLDIEAKSVPLLKRQPKIDPFYTLQPPKLTKESLVSKQVYQEEQYTDEKRYKKPECHENHSNEKSYMKAKYSELPIIMSTTIEPPSFSTYGPFLTHTWSENAQKDTKIAPSKVNVLHGRFVDGYSTLSPKKTKSASKKYGAYDLYIPKKNERVTDLWPPIYYNTIKDKLQKTNM